MIADATEPAGAASLSRAVVKCDNLRTDPLVHVRIRSWQLPATDFAPHSGWTRVCAESLLIQRSETLNELLCYRLSIQAPHGLVATT